MGKVGSYHVIIGSQIEGRVGGLPSNPLDSCLEL